MVVPSSSIVTNIGELSGEQQVKLLQRFYLKFARAWLDSLGLNAEEYDYVVNKAKEGIENEYE